MNQRIHRRKDLPARVGISVATVYKLISEGRFPKPIKLTDGRHFAASGWLESEIAEWEQKRIAARDAEQPTKQPEA